MLISRKTKCKTTRLGSRMRQPAVVQQIDEPLKSTKAQPLEGRFIATQSAAVTAVVVPIHFSQVVMGVEYTVRSQGTPPLSHETPPLR